MHENFNVFGLLMIHQIMNKLNGTLIVTKSKKSMTLSKIQLTESHPHPRKMLPDMNYTSIFNFNGGESHTLLLLGTPTNQSTTKREKVP